MNDAGKIKFHNFIGCNPTVYLTLIALVFILAGSPALAEDWPTYMHDNSRSGATGEVLDLGDLNTQAWVYISPAPPKRAWGDSPHWDAYSSNKAVAMRDFDTAIFVTVVGDDVYLGSSVTNSVHCFNATNGQEKWFYGTNSPVRFPPSYSSGKLYFGSDDGNVYCINAADGSYNWNYSPAGTGSRMICNNGYLATMWPVRTGTAVLDGKVYFAAGLVPWKSTYLCSVDATTGTELYKVSAGSSPNGAIMASDSNLYLPQGRNHPRIFSRSTGSSISTMGTASGVFALLTDDGSSTGLIYGPAVFSSNAGYLLSAYSDRLSNHTNGKCMVVADGYSYVVKETFGVETIKGYSINTQTTLSSIDRSNGSTRWTYTSPAEERYFTLISAGDVVFAGGIGKVVAHDTTNGNVIWSKNVNGQVRGLAAANQHLYVSTDTGYVYSLGSSFLPEDFNKSGQVDLPDLMMFSQQYLKCTNPNDEDCDDMLGN